MATVAVTDETFDAEVRQSDIPVVVDQNRKSKCGRQSKLPGPNGCARDSGVVFVQRW